MKRISDKDIDITIHPMDGFTLSYLSDDNRYFKQRYIFYSKREAKRRFKEYVNTELRKN